MRLILFGGFSFGKMWENMEKRPFFQAATPGLGKLCMGGYDQVGVYRVKGYLFQTPGKILSFLFISHYTVQKYSIFILLSWVWELICNTQSESLQLFCRA